jgi:hypothetical protein
MIEAIAVPVRPWEKVHTIKDHYGLWPLHGLADLDGIPHFYARQFDEEQDEWSEVLLLMPADPALVAIEMEIWAMWLRWKGAFDLRQATHVTAHERYNALKAEMGDRWRPQPERSRRMIGRFRDTRGADPSVQWTPVE